MATIDLHGADAERFRNQYRQSLGRDPDENELTGWLSGSFGGGSVDDRLRQISGSHEAQQRQQPITVGQNPNVSTPQSSQPYTVGQYIPGSDLPQTGPDDELSRKRAGLESVYRNSLGRAPDAGDIDKWLSGFYGYGSGLGDYDKYVAAIMGSPEARAYRPPLSTPDSGPQTLDWWQQRGTPQIDIFDPLTGQLKPGWERFGGGYQRTGTGQTGAPNVPGPQGGDFQQWFQQLTQGKAPTPEVLESLAPILSQYGIRIGSKGNRGWSDTIILPDGRTFDVIEAAGIGTGRGWVWNQNGGPGYVPTGGVGGGPLPGNQYSDPYTQLLESLLKSRIGNLQGGYDDFARQQYQNALQQRAQSLATGNKQLDQLLGYLQERFTDLKGPGYTGAENEVLRTQALDPIERDRAAARQRMTERLSAMGHTPESGVFQMAMQELDAEFDSFRAQSQTALASNDIARREDRAQRAEMIGAQLADIPDLREREMLDVFAALENLGLVARNEDAARAREAISYGGALSDLGPQRLQLAMQAAGMGGNPMSLGSLLTNIAGLNQNAAMFNQQNSNWMSDALGTITAIMMRSGRAGLSGVGI